MKWSFLESPETERMLAVSSAWELKLPKMMTAIGNGERLSNRNKLSVNDGKSKSVGNSSSSSSRSSNEESLSGL